MDTNIPLLSEQHGNAQVPICSTGISTVFHTSIFQRFQITETAFMLIVLEILQMQIKY